MKAVNITAYSAVTACGLGCKRLLHALFEQVTCLHKPYLIQPDFPIYTGEIREVLPEVQPDLNIYNSRNARIALAALDCEASAFREAVATAVQRYGAERVGVIIGTSTSGIYETERSYQHHAQHGVVAESFDMQHQHAWVATADFLKHELQLSGICYGISTACSSSGKAIAAGQRMIESGLCDAMVVGGVDSMCHLTIHGFHSLELTAPTPCTPLDQHRNGISLGEGAGLLLLEGDGAEKAMARLVGYGESSDAHHMTAPHPEGAGSKQAMAIALHRAGLDAHTIDYVNLHATGTALNDQSEMRAMAALFDCDTRCSATKGLTGHSLGAAGAIEAIIALLALEHQFIPGTCGLTEIDSEFTHAIVSEPIHEQCIKYVMSNNFGFGGNNVSLIFSTCNQQEGSHG